MNSIIQKYEESPSAFNSPIVLLIEDSSVEREIYGHFLLKNQPRAYSLLFADTGKEGLSILDNYQCDLILLDYNLPDISGLEFLQSLHVANIKIPVIMATGQGNERVAVQAIKLGAYDYIVKQHITPESLQATVKNALEKANLQAQLRQSEQHQKLIASIALRIRQTLNLHEILEQATMEMRQLLDCDRVFIFQFAMDMSGIIVAESIRHSSLSVLGEQIVDTCFQDPRACLDYTQGKFFALGDIKQGGLTPCHLELLERFQVKANLVMPILLSNQQRKDVSAQENSSQLWGLLIAHQCDAPRFWTPEEVNLTRLLSVQLAIAIKQAELLAKTQQSLSQEQELNALKSQVISTISHEYRSPLTSILASASTLRNHGDNLSGDTQKKLLDLIANKVRHLNNLVEDMLFLNQVEIGQIPIKPISINIELFLTELIEEFKIKAPDHRISFETTGILIPFENDPNILSQIFTNLISNAIKYSGENRTIHIQLRGLSYQIMIIIEDHGIGIPMKDKEYIFQPFYRGANVGTLPGTGLGLSIVQKCLAMCGGKISYNSELIQGTKVTVGLPRKIQFAVPSQLPVDLG